MKIQPCVTPHNIFTWSFCFTSVSCMLSSSSTVLLISSLGIYEPDWLRDIYSLHLFYIFFGGWLRSSFSMSVHFLTGFYWLFFASRNTSSNHLNFGPPFFLFVTNFASSILRSISEKLISIYYLVSYKVVYHFSTNVHFFISILTSHFGSNKIL